MKRLVIVLIVAIAIAIGGIFIYSRVMVNHTGIENKEEAALKGNSKVLVVYFSWSGNVQKMARWISEETKGELFRIVLKNLMVQIIKNVQKEPRMNLIRRSDQRFHQPSLKRC